MNPGIIQGIDLCVVIPAKDEVDNLVALVPDLRRTLDGLRCSYAILVADARSADGTSEAMERMGVRVLQQSEPGYGGALREAFRIARTPYVVTMDADNSHPPALIHHFWASRATAEIVIGSRYVQGGRAEMPLGRYLLSRALNTVYAKALSLPYKDLSSGYRLYHRRALDDIGEVTATNFEVLPEILIRAHCNGSRIREIPFRYRPRKAGHSKARIIQFGLAHLRTLWQMWGLRNSAFACDYDSRAYNSVIPLQRYWQRKRYRLIMAMLDDHTSILDIGCGSGRIIQCLPAAVALDIDLKRLRFLRATNPFIVKGDINELPFKDQSFQTIICSEVIEHVPKDARIYNEFRRVLMDGGTLIIGTPDYGHWTWPLIENMYQRVFPAGYAHQHIAPYSKRELLETLNRHGFRVIGEGDILKAELIFKAVKQSLPGDRP